MFQSRFQKHFIFVVIFFSSVFFTYWAIAGDGGVSHGGGSGVGCFDSQETAEKVKAAKGQLSPETELLLGQVFVTDFFEFADKYGEFYFPMYDEKTPEQYLERIIKTKIEILSPGFAASLRQALSLVAFEKWQAVPAGEVHLQDDMGESLALTVRFQRYPFCALIPLVERELVPNGDLWPTVKLKYNKTLYDLLSRDYSFGFRLDTSIWGLVNRAMLLLHEALYVMAVKMHQNTSAFSRELAAMLLSKNTYAFVENELDLMRMLYHAGFDRLDLFYDTAHDGSSLRADVVRWPRYEAYARLMLMTVQDELDWTKKQCEVHYPQETCDKMTYELPRMGIVRSVDALKHKLLTEERIASYNEVEAFMAMAWDIIWSIDPRKWASSIESLKRISAPGDAIAKDVLIAQAQQLNFYSLISPQADDRYTAQFICRTLQEFIFIREQHQKEEAILAPVILGTPQLWQKALPYCQRLKLVAKKPTVYRGPFYLKRPRF